MKGILADANIIGPIEALVHQMQSGTWAEFWTALGLELKRFGDVGLSPDASDLVIWQTCQAEQLILITDKEIEDAIAAKDRTLMDVPTKLVPEIQALIARKLGA